MQYVFQFLPNEYKNIENSPLDNSCMDWIQLQTAAVAWLCRIIYFILLMQILNNAKKFIHDLIN